MISLLVLFKKADISDYDGFISLRALKDYIGVSVTYISKRTVCAGSWCSFKKYSALSTIDMCDPLMADASLHDVDVNINPTQSLPLRFSPMHYQ